MRCAAGDWLLFHIGTASRYSMLLCKEVGPKHFSLLISIGSHISFAMIFPIEQVEKESYLLCRKGLHMHSQKRLSGMPMYYNEPGYVACHSLSESLSWGSTRPASDCFFGVQV